MRNIKKSSPLIRSTFVPFAAQCTTTVLRKFTEERKKTPPSDVGCSFQQLPKCQNHAMCSLLIPTLPRHALPPHSDTHARSSCVCPRKTPASQYSVKLWWCKCNLFSFPSGFVFLYSCVTRIKVSTHKDKVDIDFPSVGAFPTYSYQLGTIRPSWGRWIKSLNQRAFHKV